MSIRSFGAMQRWRYRDQKCDCNLWRRHSDSCEEDSDTGAVGALSQLRAAQAAAAAAAAS